MPRGGVRRSDLFWPESACALDEGPAAEGRVQDARACGVGDVGDCVGFEVEAAHVYLFDCWECVVFLVGDDVHDVSISFAIGVAGLYVG